MTKGYGKWFLMIFCSLVTGAVSAQAQDASSFEVDAVSVRSDGQALSRLDVYTQIPYSELSFLSTPSGFTASYEVLAEVHLLDDRARPASIVQSSIWEHSARVNSFAHTQAAQQFDFTTHSFEVDPGKYLLSVQLIDNNSQQNHFQELPIEVRDLSGSVALSDIILLKDFDEETRTIYPHVSLELGANMPTFDIFYEIYTDEPREVEVVREVEPIRKDRSMFTRVGRKLLGLKNHPVEPIILYSNSEGMTLSRGRHQTVSQIPLTELEMGDYLVRVTLKGMDGETLDVSERAFSAKWSGLATHLVDVDQAIDQLVYIAKSRDVNAIRNASTPQERLRRLENFWDKRDPTPGTLRNERMEEYYYRIDYANRKFGNYVPGWKTDRGQVLVLHGYPDDVKRHPYSFNAEPWEVWYYYRIGRQFIFIDKTGFGDFELIVPIWDERTRIR